MQMRHTWGCTTCKKAAKLCLFYGMQDGHDFKQHQKTKAHTEAEDAQQARLNMERAQQQGSKKRYFGELNEAGKIIMVVAWMMVCGISLRHFASVRIACSKQPASVCV